MENHIIITQIVPIEQSYFVEDNGCWTWEGSKDQDGYGLISATRNGYKTKIRANRWFYEKYKGPLPDGMKACHTCDYTSCVNPEHLFAGTAKQNTQDMVRKGRHRGMHGKRQSEKARQAVANANRLRNQPIDKNGRFIKKS